MNINYYRRLKNVNRLGTEAIIKPYNLLEHSYMVTVLFMHFANIEEIPYDIEIIDALLHHDILEVVTGDVPYTVKNKNANTKRCWEIIEDEMVSVHKELQPYTDKNIGNTMNYQQFMLFKTCDLLELWIFLQEEYQLGNHTQECISIIERCEALIGTQFNSICMYMDNYKEKHQYAPIFSR